MKTSDIPNEMVLCILVSADSKNVLMQKKNKGPYPGKLNGFGGRVSINDESAKAAMYREMAEETNLSKDDLEYLEELVTLTYPNGIVLHVYSGRIKEGCDYIQVEDEELMWLRIESPSPVLIPDSPVFAGDGEIAYLVNFALNIDKALRSQC